jgi:hypothetical protein
MGNFYSFYIFLHEFFAVLTTFWRISAKTHELLASILCCWRPYCAVGVHIVLLASILYCWRPYCAVGVHIVLLASISDYGYRTVIFFCYRTIKTSNIVLANSKNYRNIGYRIKASIIGLSDIGLRKN